jgi:O-acetyl-ADP-ribose deacetylase (regulator of RNase III)
MEARVLHIIKSSIFDSPAQTLVNTVNTVGVMGKGIAQGFRVRYPAMFHEYKELCDKHILKVGTLHCWRGSSRWVLNFPTKTTWKKPSKLEYIELGLDAFAEHYKTLGIRSVSFPPLGCGNGQLEWGEVRPLMLKYLWNLDIPIFIHEWFERNGVAEQHEARAKIAPVSFSEFLSDLHAVVDEQNGRFHTIARRTPFRVNFTDSNSLEVYVEKKFVIPEYFISTAWAGLQVGLLTPYTLGGEVEKYARYLLPVIAALPYVQSAPVQLNPRDPKHISAGLFLNERAGGYDKYEVGSRGDAQRCLFH